MELGFLWAGAHRFLPAENPAQSLQHLLVLHIKRVAAGDGGGQQAAAREREVLSKMV